MTPTRVALAVSAVLLIASFAAAQASGYAHTPLLPGVDVEAELAEVASATGCGDLRLAYTLHHQVWKGGVKDGHEPAEDLALMRATLRRLAWLEERGRCGG